MNKPERYTKSIYFTETAPLLQNSVFYPHMDNEKIIGCRTLKVNYKPKVKVKLKETFPFQTKPRLQLFMSPTSSSSEINFEIAFLVCFANL